MPRGRRVCRSHGRRPLSMRMRRCRPSRRDASVTTITIIVVMMMMRRARLWLRGVWRLRAARRVFGHVEGTRASESGKHTRRRMYVARRATCYGHPTNPYYHARTHARKRARASSAARRRATTYPCARGCITHLSPIHEHKRAPTTLLLLSTTRTRRSRTHRNGTSARRAQQRTAQHTYSVRCLERVAPPSPFGHFSRLVCLRFLARASPARAAATNFPPPLPPPRATMKSSRSP